MQKNPLQVNKSTRRDLVAAQPLLRFPKKPAALRFFLAFFDRCAIKTSLHLPPAAFRFSARHATSLPRCPNYSYNPKQNHPLMWVVLFWQGQKGSNPRHAVLETAALPAELYPY